MANELVIDYPGYLDPSPACDSVLEVEIKQEQPLPTTGEDECPTSL